MRWTLFALTGAFALVLATWSAGQLAARSARSDLKGQAVAAAALHAAVLRSELEKHRSVPLLLAEDPDTRAAFRGAGDTKALNAKLEMLSRRTRAAAIYLMDARGITIAASNWRLPTSFVGSDYSFRPYFRDAMHAGTAEHFALGTVSGRPGFYLARRVEGSHGPLGVIVVKVEFDGLEDEWRASGEPAFVTDRNGVVLLTSVQGWRFRTLTPLPEAEHRRLVASQQFGRSKLEPLPFDRLRNGLIEAAPYGSVARFVSASIPAATPGWTLHLLTPTDRATRQAEVSARLVAALLTGLLFLTAAMLLRRRELSVVRAQAQEKARLELEARVEARTGELRAANTQLIREMDERRRAEATMMTMQDSLVQSNKLAVLGQIAAGVAHEINQPVGAIRSYADNSVILLDRGQHEMARSNLAVIATLTERIGRITDELRDFSRKSSGRPQAVDVDDVIGGAVLLIGSRARQQGVEIVRDAPSRAATVIAERARLEQVLVNLLQNALEALRETPQPVIRICVQTIGRRVRMTVSDNGPGLSPQAANTLFTPFATTKAKGLGLGLVISRDIVNEFGGDLSVKEQPEGGAAFVISLRRAS